MSDSEPEQWTEADMMALLDKVFEDTTTIRKKFNLRTAGRLPWKDLKIEGKSSEECEKAFERMTTWVYKNLTVKEIVSATRLKLEKKKVPLEMVPNAPKRPLTAYFMYTTEKYASVTKKKPGLSFVEINKLFRQRWANLSKDKKEKYYKAYREQKAAFDGIQADFVKTQPPKIEKKKTVITPYIMYFEASAIEGNKRYNKTQFKVMDDTSQLKWIWSAVAEFRKLKKAVQDGGSELDGNPPLPLHLSHGEKNLLLKSEDIYEKPVKTSLALYRKKHKDEFKGPEQFEALSEAYKHIGPAEMNKLHEEHRQELNLYCFKLSSYIEKMKDVFTEEEVDDMKYQLKVYQRLTAKLESSLILLNSSTKGTDKAPTKSSKNKSATKEEMPKKRKASEVSPSSKLSAKKKKSADTVDLSGISDSDSSDSDVPVQPEQSQSPKKKKSPSKQLSPKKKTVDISDDSDSDSEVKPDISAKPEQDRLAKKKSPPSPQSSGKKKSVPTADMSDDSNSDVPHDSDSDVPHDSDSDVPHDSDSDVPHTPEKKQSAKKKKKSLTSSISNGNDSEDNEVNFKVQTPKVELSPKKKGKRKSSSRGF